METGWISLLYKGLSRVFSNTTVHKHQFFGAQLSLYYTSHPYMTTGKTIALTRRTFVGKVVSLLFNMLSGLVMTFLSRSVLSKSLIQFSVDGQACVPSLFCDLRPNYGGGNEDNGDLLQNVPCTHRCIFSFA